MQDWPAAPIECYITLHSTQHVVIIILRCCHQIFAFVAYTALNYSVMPKKKYEVAQKVMFARCLGLYMHFWCCLYMFDHSHCGSQLARYKFQHFAGHLFLFSVTGILLEFA